MADDTNDTEDQRLEEKIAEAELRAQELESSNPDLADAWRRHRDSFQTRLDKRRVGRLTDSLMIAGKVDPSGRPMVEALVAAERTKDGAVSVEALLAKIPHAVHGTDPEERRAAVRDLAKVINKPAEYSKLVKSQIAARDAAARAERDAEAAAAQARREAARAEYLEERRPAVIAAAKATSRIGRR